MRITLNGAVVETGANTLTELLADPRARADAGRGCAVAVNGEVVPRAAHRTTILAEDDVVEVVTAVQGG